MMQKCVVANGVWAMLLQAALVSSASAGKIAFGLAEVPGTMDPHGDSYVVAIDESETELIAHARALIDWIESGGDPQSSPGATILVTDIVAGADGLNRDFLAA